MRMQLETAALAVVPVSILRNPPLVVLAAFAVAAFGLANLVGGSDRLATTLGDTDDATRLVTVRELMAGASWFETVLARFGGAEPLVSHWSRLIDLPLAVMLSVIGPLVGVERAELAVRAVWPLMVLFPLVWLLARDAETRAGRLAGLLAIGLALTAMSGLVQFLPGRIDHHNVQILGAVGGGLLLVRALAEPRLAAPAGGLLGLGTAVGYEALLLTAATLAAASVAACWTGRGLSAMARAATAFALTLTLALLATTAPSRWLTAQCDALSVNLVVLAAACAGGLILAATHHFLPGRLVRMAMLLAPGGVGLLMFAAIEPACLRGPFGQVDPAIVPIWLDGVVETHSLLRQARTHVVVAVAWALFAGIGLAAAVVALKPRAADRDAVQLMVVVLAVGLSVWQLKLIPYATFLLVPTLAALIARLPGTGDVSAPVVRAGACLFLNQMTVTMAAITLMSAIGAGPRTAKPGAAVGAAPCLATAAVAALGRLPPGRFAGDIDLGPFIVALTRHEALAAPYHRLGYAITANHAIMGGPSDDARRRLAMAGAAYVAVCPGLQRGGDRPATGLRSDLLAGTAPDWLEQIDLPQARPVQVWRVRDSRVGSH